MSPSELRTKLLVRAAYRCEYCKRRLGGERFEREHVVPVALGGRDDLANLAVACRRCNSNKGTRVDAIDPFSWSVAPLFNPRRIQWIEHFRELGDEVVGITQIGRATAHALFRVTPSLVAPDLHWKNLEHLAGHDGLYDVLNDLRFRRIQNQFSDLEAELKRRLPAGGAKAHQIKAAEAARDFLMLELLFTRSTTKDIERGIKFGEQLLAHRNDEDVERSLSILYQQRATAGSLKAVLLRLTMTNRAHIIFS